MKVIKVGIIAAVLSLSMTAFGGEVDLKRSKITWTGTKVVGSAHTGHVQISSADIKFTGGEPTEAKVIIDMDSITNTDLTDPAWNAKLVGHLKSDDFFGTAKHKTAALHVNKVNKVSDTVYELDGELEIKGQKQPLKLKAEITGSDKTSKTVTVDFSFDRTKYGIRYGSGKFFDNLGDKMISDEVQVKVELNIKRSAQFAAK